MAITKVINSESQSYRPVLTDTLVLDAVPTVNSYNSVTSDAVARAVAGASGEVPQVTENDNGKVLKAIYDAGGPAVEWGEVESGATYTAGDGIAIDAQNAVSVKAGNGLSIGDVSTSETVTLTSARVSGNFTYSFSALSADLLSKITSGGLELTTAKGIEYSTGAYTGSTDVYAAICNFDSNFPSNPDIVYKQYVMGAVAKPYEGVWALSANSVVTFDSTDYQSSLSTLTLQEIQENPSDYFVALIQRNGAYDDFIGRTAYTAPKMYIGQGNETATYTTVTVTIQDALNVSNPLPASAIGDAGKVLTVDASGAAAWATPSGGDEVPTVTSSDDGKVLTASYSGGTGSYAWATPSGGGGGSITWYSTTNPTITSGDFGTNDVLSVTPSGLSFGNTKPGVLYISLGIFKAAQTLPTTIPTSVNVTVKVSGYDAMEEEYTIGQLNAIRFYGGFRYWVSGSVVMPAGLLSGSTTTGNILQVSLTPPDDISGKSWPTTWDDLYMSVGVVN